MADKKVERSGRERPLTPRQKFKAALSDQGTVNMADPTHDKGKASLVDKFREREERWRREQSLRDQEARAEQHPPREAAAAEAADPSETGADSEGGVP
jgi:hypothetical protein